MTDRVWYVFHEKWVDPALRDNAVWLPAYAVKIEAHSVRGISNNLSGITYNPDTKSLWVITNGPTMLFELDVELNVKRQIILNNFDDTEGVVYIGEGRYLIADEYSQMITMATIHEDTESLDRNKLRHLNINVDGNGNKGLEGITYDLTSKTIYTVRERDPMKLMKVEGFTKNLGSIDISVPEKISINNLYLDDLSGLHFEKKSQNLLLLSHESHMLAEVNLMGDKVSYIDLDANFNGLEKKIKQAEGVTMDNAGNLYIVSEPNLIYLYQKDFN